MCEVQMNFAHLKIIYLGLYKIPLEIFYINCLKQLNQKHLEYLNLTASSVFSTFGQQICKRFNNNQFTRTEKNAVLRCAVTFSIPTLALSLVSPFFSAM